MIFGNEFVCVVPFARKYHNQNVIFIITGHQHLDEQTGLHRNYNRYFWAASPPYPGAINIYMTFKFDRL